MNRYLKGLRIGGAVAAWIMLATALIDAQVVHRVSIGNGGVQANDASYRAVQSADGRVIAFESDASNLVGGDENEVRDIFLRYLETGQTVRVSIGVGGVEANGPSRRATIGGTGRFIAFESDATNLVAGDANEVTDIFVVDLLLGQIVRASVHTDGTEAVGRSGQPCLSANGRFVAFYSEAKNLVDDDTNGRADVFVRDLLLGVTTRINVSTAGEQALLGDSYAPALSSSGRYVAYHSDANNLVGNDTNGFADVFVHDRDPDENGTFDEGNGETVRVSVKSDGSEATGGDSLYPSISAVGARIAFESSAVDLVDDDDNDMSDIFVRDRTVASTTRVSVASDGSQANAASQFAMISRDGTAVAFESLASNLAEGVPFGQFAIYVHTIATGDTQHVSVSSAGEVADSDAVRARLTGDGRQVIYTSAASNLVEGDDNGFRDIYRRDRVQLSFVGTPKAGEIASFQLDHAIGEAGNGVLVLVSCSGNDGFPLPNGRMVPLTFDACTSFGLQIAALLSSTVGADGSAQTPDVAFPPLAVGTILRAAALTTGPGGFVTVTGPIAVTVIE